MSKIAGFRCDRCTKIGDSDHSAVDDGKVVDPMPTGWVTVSVTDRSRDTVHRDLCAVCASLLDKTLAPVTVPAALRPRTPKSTFAAKAATGSE